MYNSITKLEKAKAYAKLGWSVLPCHTIEDGGKCSCNKDCGSDAGKHPLTKHGYKDATRDPEKLKKYFSGPNDAANVALATGRVSGVWVLDVDVYGSLARFAPLPVTPTAETGRGGGGKHYYFAMPSDGLGIPNSQDDRVADGIDVRGDGGYAILPPSRHESGREYTWLAGRSPWDVPLAEAPAWLVERARRTKTGTVAAPVGAVNTPIETALGAVTIHAESDTVDRAKRYAATVAPAVSGSGGMNDTFRICCYLAEAFPELSEDETLEALADWNSRCVPPWSVEGSNGLRRKVRDARERVGQGGGLDIQHTPSSLTSIPVIPVAVTPLAVSSLTDTVDDDDWPVMDDDAYYGFAGEIVRHVDPFTEADPIGVLVSLLTSVGSMVGRSPVFYVGPGSAQHTNLFACLVGESAYARKGTAGTVADYVLQGIDPVWTNRRLNSLSTGEGLIAHLADTSDVEAVGAWSVAPDTKRVAVTEEEFGKLLAVTKRKENTLSGVIRTLWDTDRAAINTRVNKISVDGAHVSLAGHITLVELESVLEAVDVHNGLANRFLWVLVRRSKVLPNGKNPPGMDVIRDRLAGIVEYARTVGEMHRTDAAEALWETAYRDLVEDGEVKMGAWGATTSRGPAHVVRLSMLYALLDSTDTIDVPHLKAALAVWRYADDTARILFGSKEVTELDGKVLAIVEARPGIAKGELRNAISHKLKAKSLDGALSRLERRGRIVREERPGIGRPAECWFPNRGQKGAESPAPRPETFLPLSAPMPPTQNGNAEDFLPLHAPMPLKSEMGQTVTPAPFADLLNWRNATAAAFVPDAKGGCWVSNESGLTPALRATIEANQETLRAFLPPEPEAVTSDTPTVAIEDMDFYRELLDQ